MLLIITKNSVVNFYRFPEDKDRRVKWIAAVARKNWEPIQYSWICSDHFVVTSALDKIVLICCALCNLCKSIVSFDNF